MGSGRMPTSGGTNQDQGIIKQIAGIRLRRRDRGSSGERKQIGFVLYGSVRYRFRFGRWKNLPAGRSPDRLVKRGSTYRSNISAVSLDDWHVSIPSGKATIVRIGINPPRSEFLGRREAAWVPTVTA